MTQPYTEKNSYNKKLKSAEEWAKISRIDLAYPKKVASHLFQSTQIVMNSERTNNISKIKLKNPYYTKL